MVWFPPTSGLGGKNLGSELIVSLWAKPQTPRGPLEDGVPGAAMEMGLLPCRASDWPGNFCAVKNLLFFPEIIRRNKYVYRHTSA